MQNGSTSIWPLLTGLLGSLAGLAAFLGYLLNRRRVPAEVRLITEQTTLAEATRGKTDAESNSLAFNVVSKALADADRTIDKLKAERDYWRERAEQDERKLLEEEMKKRLGPGNGKGN